MKKLIRATAFMLFALFLTALGTSFSLSLNMPTNFFVTEGEAFRLNNSLISAKVKQTGNTVDFAQASNGERYTVDLSLLGILPIKQVNVDVVKSVKAVALGDFFGVKMFTEGVLVIGMNDVDGENGNVNPAKNAGIRIGDVILKVDDRSVNSSEQLADAISESEQGRAKLLISRDGKQLEVSVRAAKSRIDSSYKLGAWVRDSTAGIGTMTFYLPEYGIMSGLGHGICDVDTGTVMPLLSGEIVPVTITDIVKGTGGTPGEIKGSFSSNEIMGRLIMNSDTGVYAACDDDYKGESMEIAMKQEIREGPAQILSQVSGSVESYDIEIEKVQINGSALTRNMVISITDKRLLEQTGGIVQGMSGSPIVQNGKLVGAVTHVFINDPTKGYGIFAENMLETLLNSGDKGSLAA